MKQRAYLHIVCCVGLTACAIEKPSEVWESYDVRHPVPAYSQVPDGYARQYDRYIDNDSYYSAPYCYGGYVGPSCVSGTE